MLDVRVAENNFGFGDIYSVGSDSVDVASGGVYSMGTTTAPAVSDIGKAFNIWDVVIDGLEFAAALDAHGRMPGEKLTVLWRETHSRTGSFYGDRAERYVYVGSGSAYNDTVISHEFGHFLIQTFSKSDSPGGVHYLGDDAQDMRLSWDEGLATFIGCAIRKFKGYPRPELYVSTDGSRLSFSYDIESLDSTFKPASKKGSSNETAVTAALWDILDGPDAQDATPGADDDHMARPFAEIWKVLTTHFPALDAPGLTVEDFWTGWFALAPDDGYLRAMQEVFAFVNGIEFLPDAQESDDTAA
jgi:hypothetical protein